MQDSEVKRTILSILAAVAAVLLAAAIIYRLFPAAQPLMGWVIVFIVWAFLIISLYFFIDHLQRLRQGRPSRIEEWEQADRKQQEELLSRRLEELAQKQQEAQALEQRQKMSRRLWGEWRKDQQRLPPEEQLGKQPDENILFQYASRVLQELFDAINHSLEQEFPVFEQEVDAFYASPQSRDIHAIHDFLVAHKDVDEIGLEAGMTYLRQFNREYLEQIYTSPRPIPHAPYFFYWNRLEKYLSIPGLSEEQKDSFKATADEMGKSIRHWEYAWHTARWSAISKHWKPVHVLSGTYGDYNTCVCYDEEFKILFSIYPDDNYYHWGGYIMSPICLSKEDAERLTGKTLPGGTERPPCFQGYFESDENIQIQARIRPFQQE